MSLRDNKMRVLRHLGEESEPLSLSELVKRFEKKVSERSVRRWLAILVEEGAVLKIGQKRGTKYSVAKKIKDEAEGGVSSCFSSASLDAIQSVKKPLFERLPVSYSEDWFKEYEPNSTYYLNKDLRAQLMESGLRCNAQDPAGTYAHQIFNRLIIDLSYNSSRLEGNTYSLLDTERLVLHGRTAEGHLDEEKIMILNHKEAIRYLVENAPRLVVDYDTVCTIHYLLSDGLVEHFESGKVRRHRVGISGSTYLPFEDPDRLDQQLHKICEKAALIRDPYEQSIFLLIHLSYLQAFIDVNKRCARLSSNISLIKNNLVPIAFNDIEVMDYRLAMIAAYEQQDVRPMVDLYVYSYLRTCAAYDATVTALGFDEVRVRYRQQRRAAIRWIILHRLNQEEATSYLSNEAAAQIPENHRSGFIKNVWEDLELIDASRIAGLGVTLDEALDWKNCFL